MNKICYITTIPQTIRAFFIPQLRYLSENGFEISVICSQDEALQKEMGKGIEYIPVNMPRGMSVLGSVSAAIKLLRIFRQKQFDLIQYSTPNAALYSSFAAKLAGCKCRNYHLMGFRYLGAKGLERQILKIGEKLTCKNSTTIECVSKSNLELAISEHLFPRKKAAVIWNGSTCGVDITRFDYSKRNQWREEIRHQIGFKETDFIYGFVGRITKDKGVNELLKAFFSLKDDSKLLLIGRIENQNSLDKDLLSQAEESNDICFQGVVSDIEKYYAAMDVLVLPSYREGFGNVIIEAGAMGIPSIISEIPGPVDAVEVGKTALTVEVGNADDLALKMVEIRDKKCELFGKNAVQYVKNKFDSGILCEKILERKQSLLSGQ